MTPIARLLGLRVVVTNHGPDYDRDKWGPFGGRLYVTCLSTYMLQVSDRQLLAYDVKR